MKKSKSFKLLLVLVFSISIFSTSLQSKTLEVKNEKSLNAQAFYGLGCLMDENTHAANCVWNGFGLGVSILFGVASAGAGIIIAA